MQVTPLVKHLRRWCPMFASRVSGGIDWEAIEKSTKLDGMRAHVVLTDERAAPSETQNAISQLLTEQFDVCVEIPQIANDERGQAVGDLVDAIRKELCRALVGWPPASDYDPIQYMGRNLLLINRAKAVYQFSFFTGLQLGRNEVTAPAETWAELEIDGLPELTGLDLDVDFIDPMVDRNRSATGPDGRIEVKAKQELNP